MRAGCCGSKPAASGNDEADAEKITAERYREMLEVLPPARWIGGSFLVGEAMSHDDDGQARYAYYFRRGDQHFHGPDLTIAEFEAKHDEPITGHGRVDDWQSVDETPACPFCETIDCGDCRNC